MRRAAIAILGLIAALRAAAPVGAQPVDLLLVLAVDGSGSIDEEEFRFQREGYAAALTHPQVLRAIRSGERRAIGILFLEWGSPGEAKVVVDWTRVGDETSAETFAARVLAAPRTYQTWNAIGDAIMLGVTTIKGAPFESTRAVIDISGDGPDMRSAVPAPAARDIAVAEGITVNALAILNRGGGAARANLDEHYRQAVIGGPGAFVITADNYPSFAHAIFNKLVREIAGSDRDGVVLANDGFMTNGKTQNRQGGDK